MLAWVVAITGLSSCTPTKSPLNVKEVTYQSFRTEYAQPKEIPDGAKIAISYFFTPKGTIVAVVKKISLMKS